MASKEELEWWNKFSDVMAKHWRLTPYLNNIIRSEYETDYRDFLMKKGGSLLDIGCGTGWIGHYFAKNGMRVDGIDFSIEQIKNAKEIAGKEKTGNIEFFCRDLVNDPLSGRFEKYDSILINALLHHLSTDEMVQLIKKTSLLLNQNGKLYIYEPFFPIVSSKMKYILIFPFDFFIRLFFFLMKKIDKSLGLLDAEFKTAIEQGYTGASPDERPINYKLLIDICKNNGLELIEFKPYHNYGLGYAMNIMRLDHKYRKSLEKFAGIFKKLDKLLFDIFSWNNFSTSKKRTILCGAKFSRIYQ